MKNGKDVLARWLDSFYFVFYYTLLQSDNCCIKTVDLIDLIFKSVSAFFVGSMKKT